MKSRFVVFAAICGMAITLRAQQRPASIIAVTAVEKGRRSTTDPLLTTSATCDDDGNIYSRPFDVESGPQQLQVPIQKITPEAKPAGSFPVAPVQTRTFFVRDRKVYVPIGSGKGETHVAEIGPDGSLKSEVKLQLTKSIDIWHLAVFQSGEYLVVGTSGMVGNESRIPFAAVFAADGRLVKTIYEPEDEDAHQKAEGGDQKYSTPNAGNLFVMLDADVAVGSDNNAYLLHGISPALIYAISPSGNVVRKIKFSGNDLDATSIKSYKGRLAIAFSRSGKLPQNLIEVIDFQGNPLASYEIHEPAGNPDFILACYGQNGFTLIPRLGGAHPYLITATLP
jgi:hypothetical protein